MIILFLSLSKLYKKQPKEKMPHMAYSILDERTVCVLCIKQFSINMQQLPRFEVLDNNCVINGRGPGGIELFIQMQLAPHASVLIINSNAQDVP